MCLSPLPFWSDQALGSGHNARTIWKVWAVDSLLSVTRQIRQTRDREIWTSSSLEKVFRLTTYQGCERSIGCDDHCSFILLTILGSSSDFHQHIIGGWIPRMSTADDHTTDWIELTSGIEDQVHMRYVQSFIPGSGDLTNGTFRFLSSSIQAQASERINDKHHVVTIQVHLFDIFGPRMFLVQLHVGILHRGQLTAFLLEKSSVSS